MIVGIDPGLSGGIAAVYEDGRVVLAKKMPETEQDVLSLLADLKRLSSGDPVAFLEKVHASPQMGVTSSFTFGRGYGGLRMALAATGIRFHEVRPQEWQKTLSCLTKGDKNVTKRKAQDLWPDFKVTHAVADALLIAEYGRRLGVNR